MTTGLDLDQLGARWQVLAAAARHRDALELLRTHLDAHRGEPYIWTLLSQTLNNLGEGTDGESAAREALALEPRSTSALINLSRGLALQGRFAEAETAAAQALALDDQHAGTHAWLALVHHEQGRYQEALDGVQEALRLQPSGDNFALLAEIRISIGQHDQARRALADGLAADPQNRQLLLLSGRVSHGEEVVGDQAALLSSMLAASPTDRGPLDQLKQEVLARMRHLALLPWLQGVLFCFLAPLITQVPAGGAAALALWLAAAVIFRAGFLLRRLSRAVPAGFLRDLLRESPDARKGAAALIAAEAWVLATGFAAGLAGSGEGLRWSLVLLMGGTVLVLAARHLLHRAAYRALEGFTEETAPEYAAARDRYAGDRSARALWVGVLGILLGLLALLQQTYTVFAGAASAFAGAFVLAEAVHFSVVRLSLRRHLNRRHLNHPTPPDGQPGNTQDRPGRLGKPPPRVLLLGAAVVLLPALMLAAGVWLLAAGSVP